MLKVGITGGIGSGKTVVCGVFETLGIPVLYADEAGRFLMENDASVMDSIRLLFGDEIFAGGKLDRETVASIVFRQPEILQKLNAIIHPATQAYSLQWMERQYGAPYVIKEAAIFFESGTYADMDVMIGVSAPQKLRLLRAASRDGVGQEKIMARMASQMDETEKMERCDYVILNDETEAIIPQVLSLHKILLQKAAEKNA